MPRPGLLAVALALGQLAGDDRRGQPDVAAARRPWRRWRRGRACVMSPRYASWTRSSLRSVVGRVGERDRAGLEHVAARGDVERVVGVLLDEQDRRALLVDLADDLVDLVDDHRREARATARRAAAARAAPSARGRSRASAARRRTSCRPSASRAPAGAGTARRRGRCPRAIASLSRRVKAPISRFSRTVMRGKMRRPSGDWAMPELGDLVARQAGDLAALEDDRARRAAARCPRSSAASSTCRRRWSRSA